MILFRFHIQTLPALRSMLTWMLVILATAFGPAEFCFAQEPDPNNLKPESPERRKILQLLSELLSELETIERDQYLQAVEAFDAAWELAVRREDPLLTLDTDKQRTLGPGESQLYAGARSRLQQVFENADPEFRKQYRSQIAITAKKALADAVASSSVSDLTRVILRYQFTDAGQQALQHLVKLRLSRGELLKAALQFGRLLRLQEDTTANSQTQLALLGGRLTCRKKPSTDFALCFRTMPVKTLRSPVSKQDFPLRMLTCRHGS